MLTVEQYDAGVRETIGVTAHPMADRFPMLADDELQRLAEDIRENGLQTPITVDVEGRILDGRNRFKACQMVGIETPTTVVYDGDDPASVVLSANVVRRHQSIGSRAMSTALVLADAGKRENGRWKRGVVANPESGIIPGKTWQNNMLQAGTVLDFAPELAEQVVHGTLSLDAAYKQAEQARDAERQALAEQERIEAEERDAREHLDANAPDYAARIGSDFRSARQAFTAWEDDHRREAAERRRVQREAEERKRVEWDANRDLYEGVATDLSNLARYGDRDINEFMTAFEPSMLTPNILRRFTVETMRAAARAAEAFATWKEQH